MATALGKTVGSPHLEWPSGLVCLATCIKKIKKIDKKKHAKISSKIKLIKLVLTVSSILQKEVVHLIGTSGRN